MLFNSLDFLLFFPVIVTLYFALPHRFRWALLLAASYYFYACWKAEYLVLIVVSTLIDYAVGLRLARPASQRKRRLLLGLSLFGNLGLLFAFKYFNFFNDSLRAVFDQFNVFYDVPAFEVLLPVGISFYTFQTLSYTIDVYRGKQPPEPHLGIFALYVSFFPQLVAGPIERSGHLLPQFRREYSFDYDRVRDGLKLMAWGMFKKVVIADRLAVYVDSVYGSPEAFAGWPVVLASYFFTIQVYCDFSGYSDIAIGAAKVMGYDLVENFRRPFFSKSIGEFWRRWHITLGAWFRDYVYIPLGGNRRARARVYWNLSVVFVLVGLWHGADWTFIVFGGLHAVYITVGLFTASWRDKLWRGVQATAQKASRRAGLRWRLDWQAIRTVVAVCLTFHLFVFSVIFFRANSMGDAWLLIGNIVATPQGSILAGLDAFQFGVSLFFIGVMEAVEWIEHRTKTDIRSFSSRYPAGRRWVVYLALIFSMLMFGDYGAKEFFYFQF